MPNFGIINRDKKIRISFGVDPIYSINGTICVLAFNSDLDGLPDWVSRTVKALPEDKTAQLKKYGCAVQLVSMTSAGDFPSWLDELAGLEPDLVQRASYDHIREEYVKVLGSDRGFPALDEMKSSRETYFTVMKQIVEPEHWDYKCAMLENDWIHFENPKEFVRGAAEFYSWLWDNHLAAEWEKEKPYLEEAAEAFRSVDYSSLSTIEAFQKITDRDSVHDKFESWFPHVNEIRFIPSAHLGPYIMMIDVHGGVLRFMIRARIPDEATRKPHSSQLGRSEILMRLSALGDDVRLRILELASQKGEVSTQDVMDLLGLSQSSASRHLNQLAATGFLTTRPVDRVKQYSFNLKRLKGTFDALENFLTRE